MIWVAVPSGILGFFGVIFSRIHVFHPSWFPIMMGIVIVSLLFVALLGWRFRRVRAEEV
jgi:hypothetical protein